MSLISRNTPTFSKPEVRRQHLGQAADGGLHFDGASSYISLANSAGAKGNHPPANQYSVVARALQ